MDNGIIAALIGAGVTLIGIGMAAAVAVYQILKQARMGLKVELYREILAAVDKQGDGERELSIKLRVLNSLIGVWLTPDQFPGIRPSPNTTWAELNELVHKCQNDGADLMIFIEKWQIVDPRLDIFRSAFGVALRDIRQSWTTLAQLVGAVIAAAPGAPIPAGPPKDALEEARKASDQLINAASKLSAWAADFQLEVQALLLSDLFPNRLAHRQPLDPEYFVVRLDQATALKDYFENQTQWGLEMKEINRRTRQAIAEKGLS